MSNNKQQGGKPKATNGDDVLVGTSKNDNLSGKKGDDQISGLAGNDKLKGDQGNDLLDGGTGNDVLYGGKGDDRLLGGTGNDVLYGDDGKSKGWGWDNFCWWKPQSDYDDYLDGGAGSDKVYGGKGNDVAVYSMAGNLGAGFKNIGTKDDYDGGTGNDTLVLQLTYGEARLASVQQDIAAFQKFLDSKANSRGEEFEFKSFNLDVSNFEALRIELVNTGPSAKNDAGATSEDAKLVVAGPGLLANDTDADHLDVLSVIAGNTTSAKGAAVVLGANGGYSYDPSGALALQQLGAGQTLTDTFAYTITDLGGATSTATVQIRVTGVNDAPLAIADAFSLDEDTDVTGNALANDSDVDSPSLTATLVDGPAHGTLAFNNNGSFTYTPDADFFGSDSFRYKASDGALSSAATTVDLTVNAVNDAPEVEDVVLPGGGGGGQGGDATASQGSPFAISGALLLAGAIDPEGDPLFISEVSPLSELGASVTLENGNVVYDPTEGLKYLVEGEVVTDSFTYTVSDGQGGSAGFASFSRASSLAADGSTARVSLTVRGVNDAPVAGADSFTLNEDTTFTANVLGNDIDPDSPALSTSLVNGAAHGSVALNANGSFTYTPNANFFGADSFSYKASDGLLDSNVATVSLTVNNVAEPAPANKVLPSVPSDADLEYYIRFDDGGATQWLHLEHFNWGLSNAGSIVIGGGAGAGKATATAVGTTLGSSSKLVELMQDMASGQHLPGVEIEAYLPGGDKGAQLVDQYYFEEVLLTSLQSFGSPLSTAHSLSFDYAAFNRGHVTQNANGTTSVFEDGWDFQQNKDANGLGPAIAGDAIKAKVDGDSVGAELDYYVTFDGAPGWLELSSFSVKLTATGSLLVGGGGGAGKVSGDPARLSLGSSKELLQLSDGLTEGHHFKFLEVEAYASGGDKGAQLVEQYYFEDVLVSSLSASGTSDQLSVQYAKFSHGHREQNELGGFEPAVESGWDFAENKSFSTSVDADFGAKNLPLDSVPPQADLEYYIRFDDGGPTQWLHLANFSWGLSNTGSLADGGAGAGKATATSVNTILGSSNQLVQLMQDMAFGRHLPGVEIEAYAPGGEKGAQLVDQYYFEEVLLTGLQSFGAPFSTDHNLSFQYGVFNHGHVTQNANGTTSVLEDGWDFQQNKDANGEGPAIVGDAVKAKVEGDSIGAQLDYYVTFDGAAGWLKLDAFTVGLTASGSVVIGGGGGAGKVSGLPAHLSLGSSKELLLLSDGLTEGHHFKFLEIEAYAGGDKSPQMVEQYYFEGVQVSGLSGSGTSNQVSLEYEKFSHGHRQQNELGGLEPAVESGWDFVENKSFSTSVDADFGKDTPLDSVPSNAELEYYIRFDDGGATQWLHLENFNWGLSNAGSIVIGGGAGAGKATATSVNTILGSSNQLVQLMQDMVSGQHLPGVEIEAYAPGGEKGAQLVDQYYFEEVLLTRLESSGTSFSTAHSLSFDYAAFNHGHVTHNADNTTSVFEDGWDFQQNKDANGLGPAIAGDAIKAKVDGDSVGAELDYYVTFEGAAGWLKLDSFSVGLTASGSLLVGGGGGAGKASGSPANLTLGSSKELLQLSDGLTEGHHFKFLEVEAYASGGEKGAQLVEQYYFEDVLVSSLSGSGAHNQVSVQYEKFSHGHLERNEQGGLQPAVESGWNFVENIPFSTNVDSDLF